MPHPGQPYPTLVNRGEPGQSRITVINIRDHQGQPVWYSNEKHFPGWSRCLPGDPGTFPVLFWCYPGEKTLGGSGMGHESFEHPGCPRWSRIIPMSARFNSRVTKVHPGLASGVLRSRRDSPTVQCDWGIMCKINYRKFWASSCSIPTILSNGGIANFGVNWIFFFTIM